MENWQLQTRCRNTLLNILSKKICSVVSFMDSVKSEKCCYPFRSSLEAHNCLGMDSRTFDEVHVGSPSLLDKSCLSGSSICNDPTVLLGRYPTGRHFPALFCYLQTTSVQKWTIPSGESDFRNPPSFISFMQGNPSRNSHGTCSKNTEVSSLAFPTFFTLGD